MAASYSALNMKRANNLLTKSLQRLSSGKRITAPSDDAGGLAVGMKLQSALKRAAASRLNTQNGTSFLQMQDGVLKIAGEILDRMAELKSFWNDVSKSDLDRETYNHEFNELQKELSMLKGQKFNGVSVFATREPDNNPLKIITSDDGLGEHIELSRTGLFENFKSKYGADGQLNTGSHGEYRQLIGDFTRDGGFSDAVPGYTSRNYSEGSVVYKNGQTDSESGYFMALSDVQSGARIQDTGDQNSLWIRLADKDGKGFAESYPTSPVYDHTSLKFNAKGEEMAYLKGDVVKVPAHFASPGSYVYLKAQADVSRGIDLNSLFENGHVGTDGLFDFVGSSRQDGKDYDVKPLTEFLSANSSLPMPSIFIEGDAANLVAVMRAGNSLNPNPVFTNGAIYQAAGDWGVDAYSASDPKNNGDLVLTAGNTIEQYSPLVQGQWSGIGYGQGSFVNKDGQWYRAESAAAASNVPQDASASIMSTDPMEGGTFVNISTTGNGFANTGIYEANANWKGQFDAKKAYSNGDIVYNGASWTQLGNSSTPTTVNHHGSWLGQSMPAGSIADGDYVEYNGFVYQANVAGSGGTAASLYTVTPGTGAIWTQTGAATDPSTAFGAANVSAVTGTDIGANFTRSPWQPEEPTTANNGRDDVTSEFTDIDNTLKWTKTHYTHLNGSTVNTSYTRGDNILYQGKHYIYTSDLDSNNARFFGQDGYTEFTELLARGAIREVPMYVDTVGGGGSASAPSDVYFRPNESLSYVDRLPSGEVRTTNVARRTDAPLPPGDEIYNSPDDAYYGGLQAGNDGLYGTMDDYYDAKAFLDQAQNSPHVDADADNNKELLDTNNTLADFSVADFVDFIQTLANVRAVNGGTMSRLSYAERILEENEINLGAAASRIMDTDMAYESTKMARQNVLLQAAASMVTQANQLNAVVLSLLQ